MALDGSDRGIVDLDGNPLGSRTGPGGGRDDVRQFDLAFEFAADGDLYQIDLNAGQQLTVQTETPFDSPSARARNDLDPRLVVLDPSGMPIAADDNGLDGKNALIELVGNLSGTYTIQVVGESGAGEYLLEATVVDAPPADGDLTGDGVVDGRDVDLFVDTLVSGSYKAAADMDGNGAVNGLDVALFTSRILYGNNATAVDGSLLAVPQLATAPTGPMRSAPLRDRAVASVAAELGQSPDHSAALADRLADGADGNGHDPWQHDPWATVWHAQTRWLTQDRLAGLDALASARVGARGGKRA